MSVLGMTIIYSTVRSKLLLRCFTHAVYCPCKCYCSELHTEYIFNYNFFKHKGFRLDWIKNDLWCKEIIDIYLFSGNTILNYSVIGLLKFIDVDYNAARSLNSWHLMFALWKSAELIYVWTAEDSS